MLDQLPFYLLRESGTTRTMMQVDARASVGLSELPRTERCRISERSAGSAAAERVGASQT